MYDFLYKLIHTFSYKTKISLLIIIDFLILAFSHITANFVRDEIFFYNYDYYKYIIIFSIFTTFLSLVYFDVYKNFLRYTNIKLFIRIFYACLLNSLLFIIFLSYFNFYYFPRSFGFFQPFIFFFILVFSRIFLKNLYITSSFKIKKDNIIIYGAGAAGISTVEILTNYNVVALVDDDVNKQGRKYGNILIISDEKIADYINKYKVKKIFTALPSLNTLNQRDILIKLKKFNVQILNLPNLNNISSNSISYIDFENIVTNELLERDIYDHNSINKNYYENKNILITGGGGSIGSEICLQLINTNFNSLNILDHSEINIYNIKKQIDEYLQFNKIKIKINYYIFSLNQKNLLEEIIINKKIDIIFHASAYKHVNLDEHNIKSSIINNIITTFTLCSLANEYKVEKFTFISSDKAVKPTNVMGATKRIAEKIVYYFSINSDTIFSTVRFGNVINSSGSVIPIFKNQIKNNQKITVTHKDIERYFMTVSEAVSLVIESCTLSKGGETFFLNMGNRIKIYDLAVKMLKISNQINSETMIKDLNDKIQITGLNKGEKLYEELSINNNISKSDNIRIFIDNCNDKLKKIEPDKFIEDFEKNLEVGNLNNLIFLLEKYVENYKYQN